MPSITTSSHLEYLDIDLIPRETGGILSQPKSLKLLCRKTIINVPLKIFQEKLKTTLNDYTIGFESEFGALEAMIHFVAGQIDDMDINTVKAYLEYQYGKDGNE